MRLLPQGDRWTPKLGFFHVKNLPFRWWIISQTLASSGASKPLIQDKPTGWGELSFASPIKWDELAFSELNKPPVTPGIHFAFSPVKCDDTPIIYFTAFTAFDPSPLTCKLLKGWVKAWVVQLDQHTESTGPGVSMI